MSTSIVKKKIFAASLRTLLETQELIKISVTDICTVHNVSRKSFYYHFKDKYDLVEWIFMSECGVKLETYRKPDFWKYFKELSLYMYKNRKLYIQAFQSPGYDTFRAVLVCYMSELFPYYVQPFFDSHEAYRNEEKQKGCLDFLAVTFVASIENWITNYPELDIDEYLEMIRFDKILDTLDVQR